MTDANSVQHSAAVDCGYYSNLSPSLPLFLGSDWREKQQIATLASEPQDAARRVHTCVCARTHTHTHTQQLPTKDPSNQFK